MRRTRIAVLSQPRIVLARLNTQVFIGLGLAAILTALIGIYWDVTWHATIGRDSFWIPPHRLVYAGVALLLLGGLGGLALRWQRTGSLRAALAEQAGLGFVVAALGPVLQITAAPLDNLWHRLYDLDVTVWSPPHLMGIAGDLIGIFGLLLALAGKLPVRDSRPVWHSLAGSEWLGLLL